MLYLSKQEGQGWLSGHKLSTVTDTDLSILHSATSNGPYARVCFSSSPGGLNISLIRALNGRM